jgi:hypothetical protein
VPPSLATVGAPPRVKRAALLKGGVKVPVECRRACGVKLELLVDGKTARKRHLATSAKRAVVVGTASRTFKAAGTAKVAVTLSERARKALRAAKRYTLTLRSTAIESGVAPLLAEQRVAVK